MSPVADILSLPPAPATVPLPVNNVPVNSVPVNSVAGIDGLGEICDDDTPAVIWNRQLPEGFQSWIAALAPETLPSARLALEPGEVRAAVGEICDAAGTPVCAERDWLVNDVARLAETFARVMAVRDLLLRFDVVTNDACRKFHIDAVNARLICAYRGPGTQYGVLKGGEAPEHVFPEHVFPEHVFDVPTGAPVILRGTLWPGKPRTMLRHRSPPIAGSGTTRLVVVMDEFREGRDGPAVQDPAVAAQHPGMGQ